MTIQTVKCVREKDIQNYAWSRFDLYRNIDLCTQTISTLHSLPKNQIQNAKKQAEQIKYCLTQAKEYFDAAKNASPATKPVLLYYSIMSLALTEILLKQTAATSRLEALRQHHNCHGLQFVLNKKPEVKDSLDVASSNISAKPQLKSNIGPVGTFEVWKRSAREYPLGGYHLINFPSSSQTTYQSLLSPSDIPPPPLPKKGITLYECLVELPNMADLLRSFNLELNMVRSHVKSEQTGLSSDSKKFLIIHPQNPNLIDKFNNLITAHPSAINFIEINEMPGSGYILTLLDQINNSPINFPHSICTSDKNIYSSCSTYNLGEFGFTHAAMHMCGNFARYYPDIWLKHIEHKSPLYMAIDQLCNQSFDRIPLPMLSELTRIYHVEEN